MSDEAWEGDAHQILRAAQAVERAGWRWLEGMDEPSAIRTLYAACASLARAYRPAAERSGPAVGVDADIPEVLEALVAEVSAQLAERWVPPGEP